MKKHNGFITELKHRYLITPFFLEDGFTPFAPEFDTGIDLIIHREHDDLLIKIQLKSRWTIHKKYKNRGIAMAFPDGDDFYLIPHDYCIEYAEAHKNYLNTSSWEKGGIYHVASMSKTMKEDFAEFKLAKFGDNEKIYSHYVKDNNAINLL